MDLHRVHPFQFRHPYTVLVCRFTRPCFSLINQSINHLLLHNKGLQGFKINTLYITNNCTIQSFVIGRLGSAWSFSCALSDKNEATDIKTRLRWGTRSYPKVPHAKLLQKYSMKYSKNTPIEYSIDSFQTRFIPSVRWRVFNTYVSHHQWGGDTSSVQWRVCSEVQGVFSTDVSHHQYRGGTSPVWWGVRTYHSISMDVTHHQYGRGCAVQDC